MPVRGREDAGDGRLGRIDIRVVEVGEGAQPDLGGDVPRLVSARPGPPGSPITAGERDAWISEDMRAFVRGYRP
ncbi:hypothetical protein GCM10027067_23270 [Pseudactinotalea suaedae]